MMSVVIIASLVLILPVSVVYAHVQLPGPLGAAASFGVLGHETVTNTGASVINGDLGLSPGTAVTGFLPGMVTGATHLAYDIALDAHNDAQNVYDKLVIVPFTQNLTDQDLGGLTLNPGVYHFNTSAQLTGTLTLDAKNDPNSVFIFQIGSTLTTASGSKVVINNAPPNWCSKYWQVGSSATLGTDTDFVGTIIALDSITMNTSTSLYGRALALTGAVTMDSNTITVPGCSNDVIYPTPELPVVILLGLGLVGMGSYVVIRSKNQKRKLGSY